MSDQVRIVEVGPRDGLQNEAGIVSLEDKLALIEQLGKAGLKQIEAGSFVSPKWVPQMASSAEVFTKLSRRDDICYSALTPNLKGYEAAKSVNVDEVAIFTAASEGFTQKNINCSIDESIARFEPLITQAKQDNLRVRAYVSCIIACPYDGITSPENVTKVCERLLSMGCYEVSLGDTIGIGTPVQIKTLLSQLLRHFSTNQLACHFHDTYGQALANQYAALELGYRTFDTSVAGLGGCPYATGASGNVSTEDTVYMLQGAGMETGIELDKLIEAGNRICNAIGRTNQSKVALALK
ncbi:MULTISPECIES: hydroxymethylglutaryl-CoA lyase [unclassified Oleiphilus]|jgi:hydroxymethylglutaryl-CoA lyase|uniref:hydroxymethylglutaryl-CoA lyase n=1 Tax=unclassified Oleiphilus TaxID=2631174 RepID=UPI0007C25EB7|nr:MULTISPECIES: hydroxymethylglutaryl-CoA lyase [unclassified Oleiphilus]KZY48449.1 hydroxymethylglutaryl-CoA lyase [Oleiphilus sp. HI0050]KZY72687.1 hydroxymethylglutaryl-CoA lyase [Oleiphilus sp. HI0068]KZY85784.1 hydroxymethylglutaryl-CoA lyase [Oleiphilus sp. HI0072]KZY87472.1 hydroxymethylglutaryl-CoA lyase [Oleiphilus sp. HI0069]KZY31304.1 hydroxymethylglutaryl-CoA lyase [Oleiphilus sp. HI0043]